MWNHYVVNLKLIQCCMSTTPQLKKNLKQKNGLGLTVEARCGVFAVSHKEGKDYKAIRDIISLTTHPISFFSQYCLCGSHYPATTEMARFWTTS